MGLSDFLTKISPRLAERKAKKVDGAMLYHNAKIDLYHRGGFNPDWTANSLGRFIDTLAAADVLEDRLSKKSSLRGRHTNESVQTVVDNFYESLFTSINERYVKDFWTGNNYDKINFSDIFTPQRLAVLEKYGVELSLDSTVDAMKELSSKKIFGFGDYMAFKETAMDLYGIDFTEKDLMKDAQRHANKVGRTVDVEDYLSLRRQIIDLLPDSSDTIVTDGRIKWDLSQIKKQKTLSAEDLEGIPYEIKHDRMEYAETPSKYSGMDRDGELDRWLDAMLVSSAPKKPSPAKYVQTHPGNYGGETNRELDGWLDDLLLSPDESGDYEVAESQLAKKDKAKQTKTQTRKFSRSPDKWYKMTVSEAIERVSDISSRKLVDLIYNMSISKDSFQKENASKQMSLEEVATLPVWVVPVLADYVVSSYVFSLVSHKWFDKYDSEGNMIKSGKADYHNFAEKCFDGLLGSKYLVEGLENFFNNIGETARNFKDDMGMIDYVLSNELPSEVNAPYIALKQFIKDLASGADEGLHSAIGYIENEKLASERDRVASTLLPELETARTLEPGSMSMGFRKKKRAHNANKFIVQMEYMIQSLEKVPMSKELSNGYDPVYAAGIAEVYANYVAALPAAKSLAKKHPDDPDLAGILDTQRVSNAFYSAMFALVRQQDGNTAEVIQDLWDNGFSYEWNFAGEGHESCSDFRPSLSEIIEEPGRNYAAYLLGHPELIVTPQKLTESIEGKIADHKEKLARMEYIKAQQLARMEEIKAQQRPMVLANWEESKRSGLETKLQDIILAQDQGNYRVGDTINLTASASGYFKTLIGEAIDLSPEKNQSANLLLNSVLLINSREIKNLTDMIIGDFYHADGNLVLGSSGNLKHFKTVSEQRDIGDSPVDILTAQSNNLNSYFNIRSHLDRFLNQGALDEQQTSGIASELDSHDYMVLGFVFAKFEKALSVDSNYKELLSDNMLDQYDKAANSICSIMDKKSQLFTEEKKQAIEQRVISIGENYSLFMLEHAPKVSEWVNRLYDRALFDAKAGNYTFVEEYMQRYENLANKYSTVLDLSPEQIQQKVDKILEYCPAADAGDSGADGANGDDYNDLGHLASPSINGSNGDGHIFSLSDDGSNGNGHKKDYAGNGNDHSHKAVLKMPNDDYMNELRQGFGGSLLKMPSSFGYRGRHGASGRNKCN
ncbi:hypothetical protein ACFL0W_06115 [Nanoarchaeota archaeon]